MKKANLYYVFRTARKQHFKYIKRRIEPDHILYGFNHLRNLGYKVDFSDIAYSPFNLLRWFIFPLQYLLIKATSHGFKLDQAILLLPKLKKCDVIISNADSAGLPILFLKRIGLLSTPIIYISTGLANELEQRKNSLIFKIYSQLLIKADKIICHSPIEKDIYIKLVPSLKNKAVFVPFGIDVDFFKCPKKDGNYIFSIGRDKSRDYNLFSEVAKRFSNEKFVVVTSRSNVNGINFPSNVTLYFDLPYSKVRELYCSAKLVFLPLKELYRASGQIAFLEGLASGNKIVASRVAGIEEAFPDLVKSTRVVLFKTNDLKGAMETIKKASKIKEKVKQLQTKYNSSVYAKQLSNIINNI